MSKSFMRLEAHCLIKEAIDNLKRTGDVEDAKAAEKLEAIDKDLYERINM